MINISAISDLDRADTKSKEAFSRGGSIRMIWIMKEKSQCEGREKTFGLISILSVDLRSKIRQRAKETEGPPLPQLPPPSLPIRNRFQPPAPPLFGELLHPVVQGREVLLHRLQVLRHGLLHLGPPSKEIIHTLNTYKRALARAHVRVCLLGF